MALSSSNLGLPNDWAVVSSSEAPEEENESEINTASAPNSIEPVCRDSENNSQVGSQVQNVVEESDFTTHNDSTSSSDIDIIDENALDDSPEKRTYIRPSLSISSTSESSSASPPESPTTETGSAVNHDEDSHNNWQSWIDFSMNFFDRLARLYETFGDRNRMNVAVSLLLLIATYNIVRNPISQIKPKTNVPNELQELIKQLQLENKNLKNQVMLEMQNDKIFSDLEEQMKDLKKENWKLQEFILSLQKQSTAESDSKKETQNFYIKEINYLKEQINLLQFDNEELQNQLVRMRYGGYVSNTDTGKEEMEKEENSSEILSNEVKELRKDLQNEISKLKKLNELIESLTKELHKSENKASFSEEKEPLDEEIRKDEKRSDWGWKDVKNNIKDAVHNFQSISISNLFSKYVSNSKVLLEDTFKNIGHFFKTAQKAAQKEINAYKRFKEYLNEHWDSDFKSSLDLKELREKWSKLKNQYYKMDADAENVEENENNKPEFSNTFTERDPEKMKHNVDGHYRPHNYNKKHGVGKKGLHAKDNEEKVEETTNDGLPSESWVFERAADRAKFRGSEEDSINWSLRPRRDENNDGEESQIESEDKKKNHWF